MKKLRIDKAWIVLILIAFVLEIVLANSSVLRTMGQTRQVLALAGETDESGFYQTTIIEVGGPVKNVALKLEIMGTDCADVTVALTDEGDKYEYALPVKTVYPAVDDTCYFNIYPYGDVTGINVLINTQPGTKVYINEISINEAKEFSFKIIRFLAIAAIFVFFYLLRNDSAVHDFYCERGNRVQMWITLAMVILLAVGGILLARINPACVQSIWPHHGQYRELARALEQGTVKLPIEVDERLVNSENPYDTIALIVEEIPYYMDYAYYEGSYYVYFGIVPELLLYLPYYLLTGEDFNNYQAGYVFYVFIIIGAFALCWEMVRRYGRKVPFVHFLILSVSMCIFSQYIYMIARPDLYNIPILAANGFTLLGLAGWLHALNVEKRRVLFLFIGSFCMAMVAGCRPQMLLYSAVCVVWFFVPVIKERKLFSAKSIKETLCFVVPYGLAAIPVCWYNYARFGSIIDFGATYSLTSNDMNHRGVNLERVLHGIYSFLFQPPTTTSNFPYLVKTDLTVDYMGRHITEFTFGGFFAINLLLLIIWYVLFTGKRKKFTVEGFGFFLCMTICSLVITVFDVNSAGILQRYMGDIVPGFLLAAVIAWIIYLSRHKNEAHYFTISRLFCIAFMTVAAYSFFLIFAEGDSVSLMNHNPLLYHEIEAWFSL